MTTPTQAALQALAPDDEVVASTLSPSLAQRAVDGVSRLLAKRTSRRGFLLRAGLVGSAMAVDPFGYVLRPGTAYAAVCGPGSSCTSGWTVFCATINNGVNACPPGSIAAGWWKADGASLCGGSARYIVDCNATCSKCSSPGARAGICSSSCWSCSCRCGPTSSCDRRKVCCNAFRYGQCNTQVRQVGGVQCRVVSCTPPWKFDNCTTSPATDNRTRDHNSDALPQAWTRITSRYKALGENGSALRASVYAEVAVAGGRYQRYQSGRISDSSRGTWETVGAISARYVALGAETGMLGFPVSPPLAAPGGGRASRFVNGRISWHPSTGAFETRGDVTKQYERTGSEAGPLGYPITGILPVGDGQGSYSRFQKGRISYHPSLGTFDVRGTAATLYVALQAEAGPLGYPTGEPTATPDRRGTFSRFQRGRISVHPTLGTFDTRGAVAVRYGFLDAEAGPLGFPVAATTALAGGATTNRFERGRISFRPGLGAFDTRGAAAVRYTALGAETGVLGFPVADTVALAGGAGTFNRYEKGRISWSPSLGAFETRGATAVAYERLKAETGALGFPVSATTIRVDGTTNAFERGRIAFTPAVGAFAVLGAIEDRYAAEGAETGPLGYPTADSGPVLDGVGSVGTFQGGRISSYRVTGTFATLGAIAVRYVQEGAEDSLLGYPTARETTLPDGRRRSTFQRGTITLDPATGQTTVDYSTT